MATNLDAGIVAPGTVTSAQTNSISPTSGAVVLFGVIVRFGATPTTTPSVSGCGLTWTLASGPYAGAATRRLYIFVGTGTPTTGTITVTAGGSDNFFQMLWITDEETGRDTTTPVVQETGTEYTTNSTARSATFPGAWAAGSTGWGVTFLTGNGSVFTPDSPWSKIRSWESSGDPIAASMASSTADTTPSGTYSVTGPGAIAVVELAEAAAGDTDPPTLSSATATATGSTTADWSITTNEAGTRYSVAGDPNNTPTDVQVMAGQDHTGSAAVWGSSGAAVVGANAGTATGLAPSTSYRIYHVVEDAATNVSAVASSASFTTVSATSESPTDSYTLTDATQDSVAAAEAQADSTTLGEGVGLRLGFSLDDDTLTLAEIVAGQLAVVQSVADTATLGDAATENVVVAVSLSDSLTLSDDAVAGGVAESRADALTMADEVTASVRAAESVADSVSLSDTVSVRIAAVASVVDSYTLGDTLVTVLATSMSVLDSLTMTDVLAVPMPFNVHPSNILSIQRASPRILTR